AEPLFPQQGGRHLRGRDGGGGAAPARLQHAGGGAGRSERRRHARRGGQQRGAGGVRAAGQTRIPGGQKIKPRRTRKKDRERKSTCEELLDSASLFFFPCVPWFPSLMALSRGRPTAATRSAPAALTARPAPRRRRCCGHWSRRTPSSPPRCRRRTA